MQFRSLTSIILRSNITTPFTKHTPHILTPHQHQFSIRRRFNLYTNTTQQCDITTTTTSNGHDQEALKIQNILKRNENNNVYEIERALNQCQLTITEDLVVNVLKRHRSDWRPAYAFFIWVSRGEDGGGYLLSSSVYNEILDILGKLKRFDEVHQVLDELSQRKIGVFNEITYRIVINRYAGAHKIDEATEFFYRRTQFGLRLDLIAFQTLLIALCRYKHVEAAEFLFHSKQKEFRMDIKTRNIILNGWCVLGSLREAKRFWNDIITSKCKPDKFTYGIFINSLSKAGKLSTAVKLFRAMWEKGCDPDAAICNCIIDGLCFKKRIPEAIAIFEEMNDRDCVPDVATYNSLIKHICNIGRMGKVYELLDDMERKGGSCLPNARTYGYLLSSAKKPEDVPPILERMERNGCKMTSDVFNLLLRLFMEWGNEERVKSTWVEMEQSGLGPDQRSYTIMVHGLFEKRKMEDALQYFNQMTSKGLMPEPRTRLLVNAIHIKLQDKKSESGDIGDVMNKVSSLIVSRKDRKKTRKAR